MITADQYKSETDADMLSVLTLLSVKGLNPLAYCIVEILTDRFVTNAERAGANQIIGTSEFISRAMLQHYQVKLRPPKQQNGIKLTLDQHVELLAVPDELKGAAYKTCVLYFLDHNTTIIGVQKEEGPMISPPLTCTRCSKQTNSLPSSVTEHPPILSRERRRYPKMPDQFPRPAFPVRKID